jgi:hypothetical protein
LKLSIAQFAFTGGGTTVEVDVGVATTTTAPVTLTIVFAGSNTHGSPGSTNVDTRTYVLSGQTSYSFGDKTDGHTYCASAYTGVHVSTTPAAQGGGPVYADLTSPKC